MEPEMQRILVIDDDEHFLSLMSRMLDRAGYEVVAASDGREGIRVCQKTRVDLVITDVVMPEMEGLEVIMELKRKFSGMRIIAISGGGRIQPGNYLDMAAALGASRTLTKPFSCEEFLETVRELTSCERNGTSHEKGENGDV